MQIYIFYFKNNNFRDKKSFLGEFSHDVDNYLYFCAQKTCEAAFAKTKLKLE